MHVECKHLFFLCPIELQLLINIWKVKLGKFISSNSVAKKCSFRVGVKNQWGKLFLFYNPYIFWWCNLKKKKRNKSHLKETYQISLYFLQAWVRSSLDLQTWKLFLTPFFIWFKGSLFNEFCFMLNASISTLHNYRKFNHSQKLNLFC